MKAETILTIVLAVVAVAMTATIGYTGFQISKVSDLASEIHNTNSRIDSIYPLMVQTEQEIGTIKGSLEVSAIKIASAAEKATAASDRADAVTKELSGIAQRQDEQVRSIREIADSVSKLVNDTRGQQNEIDDIGRYIRSLPAQPPIKKTDFISGAYVFTSEDNLTDISLLTGDGADLTFSKLGDQTLFEKIVQAQKDKKIDMHNFLLVTKEPVSAKMLMSILTNKQ
jgi:hypothetical protein